MNTATLDRKERRRLERLERKKALREQKTAPSSPSSKKRGWGFGLFAFITVLAVSAVAASVFSSNRTNDAESVEVSRQLEGDYIVQVFLGSRPSNPEILQVARATADWHRGKMNEKETEMWVDPTQQFWVSNRNAMVTAAELQPGDRLLQHDRTERICTGVLLRPVVPGNDFVAAYKGIHGEDASVPLGEPGMYLSKVTETFEREVDEVYQIFYGSGELPADLSPVTLSSAELEARPRAINEGEGGSVFVTDEHPYYVLNKARFVPVKELEPGDRFRDFDGKELVYHGRRLIRSNPGDPFKVYNIEVADNHTYFAGKEAVWVHNICSEAVERYTSIFLTHRKADSIDDALKKTLEVAVYSDKISTSEASVVARSLLLREGRSPLFDLFDITPGTGIDLTTASAPGGRSFITYVFKNSDDQVVYVGRASGSGNPSQVLQGRISRGHAHYNDQLTTEVVDVQKTKLANQGAEEFFIQGYRELGAPVTNIDEALSFANTDRTIKSITKLDSFFEELFAR